MFMALKVRTKAQGRGDAEVDCSALFLPPCLQVFPLQRSARDMKAEEDWTCSNNGSQRQRYNAMTACPTFGEEGKPGQRCSRRGSRESMGLHGRRGA